MMISMILLVTFLSIQGTYGVDTRNVNTGRVIGDLNTGYADQPMYDVFTFFTFLQCFSTSYNVSQHPSNTGYW